MSLIKIVGVLEVDPKEKTLRFTRSTTGNEPTILRIGNDIPPIEHLIEMDACVFVGPELTGIMEN